MQWNLYKQTSLNLSLLLRSLFAKLAEELMLGLPFKNLRKNKQLKIKTDPKIYQQFEQLSKTT